MVAEQVGFAFGIGSGCSLAKISMVAEPKFALGIPTSGCSLAKISMVAELRYRICNRCLCCSLAKISMVAELLSAHRLWIRPL